MLGSSFLKLFGTGKKADCKEKREETRDPVMMFYPGGGTKKGCARGMVLSEHVALPADMRASRRNLNTVVFGNMADAVADFVGPNIMQADGSFVILDPGGEICDAYAESMEHKGYRVRKLDLIHMDRSAHYDPFSYVRSDADIEDLVQAVISNTPHGEKERFSFMKKYADMALLAAVFLYIHYYGRKGDRSLAFAADLLCREALYLDTRGMPKSGSGDDGGMCGTDGSPLDALFARIEEEDPDSYTARQYKVFLSAAGCSHRKEIVGSCLRRLDIFTLAETADLMRNDDMYIDRIWNEKTAVFVAVPENDSAFSPIAAMFFTQFFRRVRDYCENAAEYSQVVTDCEGNVVRCFGAGAEDEAEKRAEAEAFLAEAKEGKVCCSRTGRRYEAVTPSGDLICFRGSEEDAEKALEQIKKGKVVSGAARPNGGMTLPVRTMAIFAGLPDECRIPGLEITAATAHRCGISVSFVLESLVRIQEVYADDEKWIDIIGSCDSAVILGGGCDSITAKWASKMIGRTLKAPENSIKNIERPVRVLTDAKDCSPEALQRLPRGRCVVIVRNMASVMDRTCEPRP